MNIMSIDIDFLFNGHTYRDYINYDLTPKTAWKVIDIIKQEVSEIDTNIDIDTFAKLLEIVKSKCSKAKFRIIDEHNEIVDIMRKYKCKNSTIWNFDAHHDITYGENNDILNLENWVLHAKNERLIDKYVWVHRILSDMCYTSPIDFRRVPVTELEDCMVPEMDLVVVCISHHFTPKKYWDIIPNTLSEAMRGSGRSFLEVTPTTLSLDRLKGLNDLLIDGTMPDIHRLFRNNDSWVIAEKCEDNGIALSMVSFDNGDIWKYREVVDLMITEYSYVEFNWVSGIRNERYIKRLANNYNILVSREGYIKIGGIN